MAAPGAPSVREAPRRGERAAAAVRATPASPAAPSTAASALAENGRPGVSGMGKARLEAFSDGVVAILITILVLELKVPHGTDWAALRPLLPVFLTYLLSFVYLGIYWVNHHHLLHTLERVTGGVLWANLHLLLWLSLVPFTTGWMGENHGAAQPAALYGLVLLGAAVAYTVLQATIIAAHGPGSKLAAAVGRDLKGKASIVLYVAAIPLAFVRQELADALFVTVALIWLVPDRRIERLFGTPATGAGA